MALHLEIINALYWLEILVLYLTAHIGRHQIPGLGGVWSWSEL